MAEQDHSLSAPLLSSNHVALTIDDHPHSNSPALDRCDAPFAFIGADGGFDLPESSTIDPFRNHTPGVGGLYEWAKIVVCLPLVLVRLLLFGLFLLLGYLATHLALCRWKDRQNPMPRWRCRVMWITRLCGRAILFSFGYHWIKRKGKPSPREIAPIIVSNHVSYIEPIFFFYELCPTMVASESHDSMPFVGTIIRAMQVIYVNRYSRSSRKHAVNEIKRKASSNQFPRVLLFPEGTTTNGRVIISFQLGAFIPGYPVQPVIVRYPYVHFDQSWGNISLARLMFRMFTQFHNFMEVEYLPVVSPHENRKENACHFAQRENPSLYMVEMGWALSTLHLRPSEALEFLEIFLSMNPDSSGHVEFHDFVRALRLKPCGLSEKVFGFVDVEKIGKITFKQFLFGSVHILKQPLFHHACEAAFRGCDGDEKSYILIHELRSAVSQSIPYTNLDEINTLFNLFDVDSDGRISKNDFISCLRRYPLLIAIFGPKLLHRGLS